MPRRRGWLQGGAIRAEFRGARSRAVRALEVQYDPRFTAPFTGCAPWVMHVAKKAVEAHKERYGRPVVQGAAIPVAVGIQAIEGIAVAAKPC